MGRNTPPVSAISFGRFFWNRLVENNGNAPQSGGRSYRRPLSGTRTVRRKDISRTDFENLPGTLYLNRRLLCPCSLSPVRSLMMGSWRLTSILSKVGSGLDISKTQIACVTCVPVAVLGSFFDRLDSSSETGFDLTCKQEREARLFTGSCLLRTDSRKSLIESTLSVLFGESHATDTLVVLYFSCFVVIWRGNWVPNWGYNCAKTLAWKLARSSRVAMTTTFSKSPNNSAFEGNTRLLWFLQISTHNGEKTSNRSELWMCTSVPSTWQDWVQAKHSHDYIREPELLSRVFALDPSLNYVTNATVPRKYGFSYCNMTIYSGSWEIRMLQRRQRTLQKPRLIQFKFTKTGNVISLSLLSDFFIFCSITFNHVHPSPSLHLPLAWRLGSIIHRVSPDYSLLYRHCH